MMAFVMTVSRTPSSRSTPVVSHPVTVTLPPPNGFLAVDGEVTLDLGEEIGVAKLPDGVVHRGAVDPHN